MGLLDKAKAAAEQAAAKAKEGAQDLQTRKDLFTAYQELGKGAFELAEKGELDHPELEDKVSEIRRLRAALEDGDGSEDGAAAAAADAGESAEA